MRIKLFTYANAFIELELLGPLDTPQKQTFVELRKVMSEGDSMVDWPFEVWDVELKCVSQTKV